MPPYLRMGPLSWRKPHDRLPRKQLACRSRPRFSEFSSFALLDFLRRLFVEFKVCVSSFQVLAEPQHQGGSSIRSTPAVPLPPGNDKPMTVYACLPIGAGRRCLSCLLVVSPFLVPRDHSTRGNLHLNPFVLSYTTNQQIRPDMRRSVIAMRGK